MSNSHAVGSVATFNLNETNLEMSVPARFAQIVRALPQGHLAYVGTDGEMTYTELDQESDRLAHNLIDVIGPGADDRQKAVSLLLPHTAASVIGIMGVLKSGHFLVPMAPEHGLAHHARIVTDCPPDICVTTTALLPHAQNILATRKTTPILLIDNLPAKPFAKSATVEISPQSLAIIFYTSGSTGTPRGVLRNHRQILAYAHFNGQDIELTYTSRVAHTNSFAFGSSANMLYGGLLNGATLYAFALQKDTLVELYRFLLQQQVTVMVGMISTMRSLADLATSQEPLVALRTLIIGGESIHQQDIAQIKQILSPECRLMFALGSTELSTHARFFIQDNAPGLGEQVPVGYAPEHMHVIILDESNRPVPPNTEGQIAVRSRYITPGYWNRPDLNGSRFLPDPDGGDQRIFLTGDRGKMTADGLLYYLGRMDFMVKIRGYRVEPESIEIALQAHPAIRECVVVPFRPSVNSETRLIVYFSTRDSALPTVSDLRNFLTQSLPPYMIPARFIHLERLPRTANGKVDRQALPLPGKVRPDLNTPFLAPRSELEQQLADIWAELLELDEVGVEDDFFALGGDSLAALRMALAVEEATGQRVPTDSLAVPTVAHLAGVLVQESTASQAVAGEAKAPPLAAASREPARSLRGRLRTQAIEIGPLWHGHGLPYGVGVRLQRWLIAQPLVRRRYARQLALVERWSAELGLEDAGREHAIISWLANTWLEWRRVALSRAANPSDWVTVNDPHQILSGNSPASAGVVLAVSHTGRIGLLPLEICRRNGRETGSVVGGARVGPQLRSELLLKAERILRGGGAVMVAADGYQGQQAVDVPFWGRRRPFQIGAAELAVTTGSALVPVYITFDAQGRITFEVTAPLETQALTTRDRIRELTELYGADYAAHWPQGYVSMRWHHLAHNLNLPPW
ncbi:MAG: AMP-binding protein [Anaerolineae bacterium]|jgi:amino acid adenylation domain-containing protein|nr:AMP-binding protein [Anaerolineae bacterium]